MAKELTIVSVYHNQLSKRLLELNREFTRAQNPASDFVWLVGDNTPQTFSDKISEKEFTIVPNREDYHGLGSHQHAGAINKCLKEVKTRFVLSLDSDFYILRKNWIAEVLSYMKANNLAFFGVTYHTQDYSKYRYFPSVVCVFIDLEKVPLETLDFMPQMELKEIGGVIRRDEGRKIKKKVLRKKIKRFFPAPLRFFLSKIMRTLDIKQRKAVIGTGRDTSYRIYMRYGNDEKFDREYATVVFNPSRDPYFRAKVWISLNWIIEKFLPDSLCYLPKKRDSYSAIGFKEHGFVDLRGFGWEEYLWQAKPFGTHIRGSKTWKRNENEDDEIALIKQTLETFTIERTLLN